MPLSSVRYLDQFVTDSAPTVNEQVAKAFIASRLKEVRKERGLTQRQAADHLACSHTTISFWESGRVLPGIAALQSIHVNFGVDLNWLLRTDRTLPQVTSRNADRLRISRIFRRIDAISGSIRIMMVPDLRALIARAIYTANECHETAFFNLLETRGTRGFTGHTWVMNLEDGRTLELAMAARPELALQERIKLIRLRLGLTSHAFSTTLGVPQTTWLTWEGGREPHLTALIQTFGRLDVDLNWLLASTAPRYEAFGRDFDWEELLR